MTKPAQWRAFLGDSFPLTVAPCLGRDRAVRLVGGAGKSACWPVLMRVVFARSIPFSRIAQQLSYPMQRGVHLRVHLRRDVVGQLFELRLIAPKRLPLR